MSAKKYTVILLLSSLASVASAQPQQKPWEIIAATSIKLGLTYFKEKFDDRFRRESALARLKLFNFDAYKKFEPVRSPVAHIVKHGASLTEEEVYEVRMGLVQARHGYMDYSDLVVLGALDAQGYVINSAVMYEHVGQQVEGLGSQRLNWARDEIDFSSQNFDVVRVMERDSPRAYGKDYQANVTLLKNRHTGEYTISVGGTDSCEDIKTDLVLAVTDSTGAHGVAVDEMVAVLLAEDVPPSATVNLAGHSLGGAAILELYRKNPQRYGKLFVVQGAGYGGEEGSYYERKIWRGLGDDNIVEIYAEDPDPDDNEMTTFWGHVGAGTIYDLSDILVNVGESELVGPDSEIFDSHWIGNLWASLE